MPPNRHPPDPFAGGAGAGAGMGQIGAIASMPPPMPKRVPDGGDSMELRPNSRHVLRPPEEYVEFEEENRLRIDKSLWPPGFALQWVTETVFGQEQPQHVARFRRQGWVSVMADEFDGIYGNMFCPTGYTGDVKVDGLVLMARPQSWNDKALALQKRRAMERVWLKEQQMRSGDLPGVTLDPTHKTAVGSNIIDKTMESILIPQR